MKNEIWKNDIWKILLNTRHYATCQGRGFNPKLDAPQSIPYTEKVIVDPDRGVEFVCSQLFMKVV